MRPISTLPKLLQAFLIALLISLFILYIAQTVISQSDKSRIEDFVIFYTAGTIARTEGMANIYDLQRQLETQRQILGKDLTTRTMLVYNHLPILVPLFYFLTHLDYGLAALLWGLFLLGLYTVSVKILLKLTHSLPRQIESLLAASLLLFYPIYVSLYHGQDTAFLFFGLTSWYFGQKKRQESLSIGGLLLTTLRPHISAGLLLAYAITHPQQIRKIFLAGAVWAAANIVIVGPKGTIDFLRILSLSAQGTQLRMSDSAMLNLLGLLTRSFETTPASLLRAISWGGVLLGILLAIWVWKQSNQTTVWKMSINILIALFFAPHLHYHDLAIVAIPLTFALSQSQTLKHKLLLTGVLPLFSLITLAIPAWYQTWPYLLYGFLVILLLQQRADLTPPTPTGKTAPRDRTEAQSKSK